MELVEDDIGGFGPDEGLGVIVVLVDVAVDGGLEIDDGLEGAAADAPSGEDGEEAFDGALSAQSLRRRWHGASLRG